MDVLMRQTPGSKQSCELLGGCIVSNMRTL